MHLFLLMLAPPHNWLLQVYSRRAEVIKCALKAGKNIRKWSYSNVICDLKESFQLHEDLKVLVDAIILADEHGVYIMCTELHASHCLVPVGVL